MSSGVYKITCKDTNKIYIGSSKDIKKRWYHHVYDLKKATLPGRTCKGLTFKYIEDQR